MALAFANIFDDSIVQNIQDLIPRRFSDWETLYGKVKIYETDHYITYGGGPEGGYVYFYRERPAGWYTWNREWFGKPEYRKIETGLIVFRLDDDGCETIAWVPDDWEYEEEPDEIIIIGDNFTMQERDRGN